MVHKRKFSLFAVLVMGVVNLALVNLAFVISAKAQAPRGTLPVSAQNQSDSALGRRVALVIGNGAYQHTPVLKNPAHDAADVAGMLRSLGFEVVDGQDLDKAGMDKLIRRFAGSLSGTRTALFFYAGHGLQVGGANYLVPVDAQLTSAAALDFEMIRLDLIQRTMERETTANVLILDACRDNPLARNLARALGTRSAQIGRGLAAAESGEGTLISFSTQPGNVALDGTERNSPFATALLRHMPASGEDLSSILVAVRNDVMAATARRQVPWEHSALTAKFYFSLPKPKGPTVDEQIELTFWSSVKDSTDPDVLRSYLNRFPDGIFAPLASALIEQALRKAAAEQAAKEEARSRQEQALKTQQLKQAEEERRQREAVLFDERRRAEENKNLQEAARLREQQMAELQSQSEALRRLHDEVRAAMEAAAKAEELRRTAEEEAQKAAAAAKVARAKQVITESPARPEPYIDLQDGSRYTQSSADKVRALVDKHNLPLPDFRFETPKDDVPKENLKFLGMWADVNANSGRSRKIALIVTRVTGEADADGYLVWGLPGPSSWQQTGPSILKFSGKLTAGVLRFVSAGSFEYKVNLIGSDRMKYLGMNKKTGQTDPRTLEPIWRWLE